MSRRFGRNQRRRMREQLAAEQSRVGKLEAARVLDLGLMADQRRRLQDAEDFTRAVAGMVGRHSVIVGAAEQTNMTVAGDFQIVPEVRLPDSIPDTVDSIDCVRVELMRLLDIEIVRDHFARAMHVRAWLKDGKSGYAISDSAIMETPEEFLIQTISVELATHLVQHLKKGRRT